jgi:dipeptidyl aminopeptidase/acylaminoacyl peptidase
VTGSLRPTGRELLDLVTVDDPRISPDGSTVAWLETRFEPDRDGTTTALKLASSEGDGATRTLLERSGLRRPRWSPDGRALAFLAPSDDGAGAQVASIEVEDGAAGRWARIEGTVLDLAWSPRGDGLAVVARLPDPEAPADDAPPGVVRTSRLGWKVDGAGLIGDRWTQLLWLPADGGPPVPLVGGRWDATAPSWSPDGSTLAFLAPTAPDSAGATARRRDLWLIDVEDGRASSPRRLTSFADVRIAELAWSADGRRIALAAHERESIGHYGAQRLATVDVASGATRFLSDADDGTLGNAAYTDVGGYGGDSGPRWAGDDGAALATISRRGTVRLYRVETDGRLEPLTPDDRVVAAWTVDREGRRAALLRWDRSGPGTIEVVDLSAAPGPSAMTTLASAGGLPTSAVPVHAPRHLRVAADPATDAPELDAWLLLPHGADAGSERSVPLILYCGGGPGGMRSDNYFFEFQLFAAAGYAVAWLNARGCQGYGDPFCTAILGDWGGADWEDEQRALDAALAAFPALDPERVAIVGGSYGGYQVNWAIGRSDRFRAAVADRSVSNRLSAFGTSDIGFLRTFEYDGATPWEDPHAYLAQTPLQGIGGARTPTLVVHSAQDYRCPIEQGEQLYFALRAQGTPAELVRFPNESHGLSRGGRPWHRVARLDAYLDWLDRWLR